MSTIISPAPSNAASSPADSGASARQFGTIASGTAEFTRTNRALFFGGFSTFALLYCVQPLMPQFSHEFGLSPAQSSATLSVATAALAICLLLLSAVSDRLGRKKIMCAALLTSAVLTMLCAEARDYHQLLFMRALLGVALAGVPAVAMAYLSEEIAPLSLGFSMGLYIGGSALGGMAGRVVSAWIADAFSWRAAFAVIGAAGVLAGLEFARSLPPSRNFHPRAIGARALMQGFAGHLRDAGLPWLFLTAFLLMGCFVSLYNYIGYRLMGPEFGLRPAVVGAVFLVYVVGVFSAVWAGKLADRFGRRNVLWLLICVMLSGLLLTLLPAVLFVVLGICLFTFGFFGSHSVASSWVGRRARAPQALASALYLFSYYAGASIVGSCSGLVWAAHGWGGVVALLAAGLCACLAIAVRLRSLQAIHVIK